MASKQSTVDFIVEQASKAGTVSARKLFGEYGLYCDGKMVALVCDDQLYIKPTQSGRAHIGAVTESPPYQGAKPCFLIPGDKREDAAWPTKLVHITAACLPAAAKRTTK